MFHNFLLFYRQRFLSWVHCLTLTEKSLLIVDVVHSLNGDQIISAGYKLTAKVLSGYNSDFIRNANDSR